MPPFPHRFQVPVTLAPTVQLFCPSSLTSLVQQWFTLTNMQHGNIASRTNGAGCRYTESRTYCTYISRILQPTCQCGACSRSPNYRPRKLHPKENCCQVIPPKYWHTQHGSHSSVSPVNELSLYQYQVPVMPQQLCNLVFNVVQVHIQNLKQKIRHFHQQSLKLYSCLTVYAQCGCQVHQNIAGAW